MKKFATFALLALLVAAAPSAYAALQISYVVDGLPAAATICGTSSCGSVSVDNLSVLSIGLTSNSPGGPLDAEVFGATLQLKSTAGDDHIIDIWFAAQDFSFPTAPPAVDFISNNSLTFTSGSGSVQLTSCVDTSNGLTPPTNSFCSAGTALTNNTLAYSGGGVAADSVHTQIGSLGTPYSLSQHLTIDMKAGSTINLITSASLTPTPEPASIVLLGTMLLGVTALVRKKFKRA
jgi:hypothetical protein